MGGDSEMTKAVSGSDVVIDSAADALLRNGWVVLDGLIEPGVLKDLRDEMTLALCGLPHYAYPFGEQRRIPANARRHEFPVTHQVLLHGPLGAICEQYCYPTISYGARSASPILTRYTGGRISTGDTS
jgi:hypothetical protein